MHVVDAQPLRAEEAARIDAYWRAANYLSVGQIYLMGNPLLRDPLVPEQVKPRLLGHRGHHPPPQPDLRPPVPDHRHARPGPHLHEGGELGYSLAHTNGATLDNPGPGRRLPHQLACFGAPWSPQVQPLPISDLAPRRLNPLQAARADNCRSRSTALGLAARNHSSPSYVRCGTAERLVTTDDCPRTCPVRAARLRDDAGLSDAL